MPTSTKGKSTQLRLPRVTVIGFGSQGQSIALNLRDSGYKVTVALRPRSRSRAAVRAAGKLHVAGIAEAVRDAEVVCFAFPDHLHRPVFERDIRPNLRRGAALWFLHGSSIHFGLVTPPPGVAVLMIAPHAPGKAVREEYLGKRGLSAFYAVHGRSASTAALARRLAAAVGIRPRNLLRTTFEREAVGDLFGEQAVLCGGLAALIQAGFQTLVNNGWPPEHAYLEVAHQLDLIVALLKQDGIAGMLRRISPAARLGSVGAGPKIIDQSTRRRMQKLFDDIRGGKFARELAKLDSRKIAQLDRAVLDLSDPRLERAARRFRRKSR